MNKIRLIGLACVLIVASIASASAANCGANTRKTKNFNTRSGAKTYLVNHTDAYVSGAVYRNGEKKAGGGIKPGGEMVQNARVSGEESRRTIALKATFSNDLGHKASCSYTVTYRPGAVKTNISKVECEDASKVCNGCTISCTRGFNVDKALWVIRLHLNPPPPKATPPKAKK